MQLTFAQQIASIIIPLIFAITTHEVAHGWVACRLGDKTALMMGRITFNPIKHIDPIGTVALPALLVYLGGVVFGWAKPVPVNFRNLRNPRRDMALVAIAGPMTNLIMAIMWGAALKFSIYLHTQQLQAALYIYAMATFGVRINLVLMVLNFLPIPPLDGSRVVESLLPPKFEPYFRQLENFGFLILLGLLYFGVLWSILMPPVEFSQQLIYQLYNMRM